MLVAGANGGSRRLSPLRTLFLVVCSSVCVVVQKNACASIEWAVEMLPGTCGAGVRGAPPENRLSAWIAFEMFEISDPISCRYYRSKKHFMCLSHLACLILSCLLSCLLRDLILSCFSCPEQHGRSTRASFRAECRTHRTHVAATRRGSVASSRRHVAQLWWSPCPRLPCSVARQRQSLMDYLETWRLRF